MASGARFFFAGTANQSTRQACQLALQRRGKDQSARRKSVPPCLISEMKVAPRPGVCPLGSRGRHRPGANMLFIVHHRARPGRSWMIRRKQSADR